MLIELAYYQNNLNFSQHNNKKVKKIMILPEKVWIKWFFNLKIV